MKCEFVYICWANRDEINDRLICVVQSLCPGLTQTEFTSSFTEGKGDIALRASDVADAVVYALSAPPSVIVSILTQLSVTSYTLFYLQGAHLIYSLAQQNKTEPIYNLFVEKHFLHSIFVRTTQSIECLTTSLCHHVYFSTSMIFYGILKIMESGINKGEETVNQFWISKGQLYLYTQVGQGYNRPRTTRENLVFQWAGFTL